MCFGALRVREGGRRSLVSAGCSSLEGAVGRGAVLREKPPAQSASPPLRPNFLQEQCTVSSSGLSEAVRWALESGHAAWASVAQQLTEQLQRRYVHTSTRQRGVERVTTKSCDPRCEIAVVRCRPRLACLLPQLRRTAVTDALSAKLPFNYTEFLLLLQAILANWTN